MNTLKAGDKVRLTGHSWKNYGLAGEVGVMSSPRWVRPPRGWWPLNVYKDESKDYSVTLIEDDESDQLLTFPQYVRHTFDVNRDFEDEMAKDGDDVESCVYALFDFCKELRDAGLTHEWKNYRPLIIHEDGSAEWVTKSLTEWIAYSRMMNLLLAPVVSAQEEAAR